METAITSLSQVVLTSQVGYLIIGTIFGVIAGAIPGINGGMLMVLSLPLTYYIASDNAIVMLVGMYVGGVTGGLVPALLIRIPGDPSSLVTTFDGYPMTQRGEKGRAFALAITASFIGGLISWAFLITLSPLLTSVALSFSDYEYFAFVIMGIAFIATISGGSLLRGMISAVLGMMVAIPGIDQVAGIARLEFGFDWMLGGFDMLAVLIGIFAGSQLLGLSAQKPPAEGRMRLSVSVLEIVRSVRPLALHTKSLLRSSVIGTWIGILPGLGASVGSLVSYGVARNLSKNPEKFGTGHEDGVVSCEAANNATVGGALIPLITIGIPASVGDAILISALLVHNVQVGPLLFQNHPEVYFAVLGSAFWANFVILATMIFAAPLLSKLIDLPQSVLVPVLWVFCVIGAFATNNNFADVWVMLAFAAIGFLLEKFKFPLGPFVIGLILGPLAERTFRAGLMASDGSYLPFIERPVAAAALGVSAALVLWSLWKEVQTDRLIRSAKQS